MKKRKSGLLLHITSLSSDYGIGDLGPSAYEFADFLAESSQSFWQVLPLVPTNPCCGYSPYSSISAWAANTLLISPDLLLKEGLLSQKDLEDKPTFPQGFCDYDLVVSYKEIIFSKAYNNFKNTKSHSKDYINFCKKNINWLDDFSIFELLKNKFDRKSWNKWPEHFKNKNKESIEKIKKENKEALEKTKFLQYVFFKQWRYLKAYCNKKNISFIGDVPIYVDYDSVDLWSNPNIFKLDKEDIPTHVAGVPPDYFSSTGQLWGNPLYRWDVLKKQNFKFWIERIKHNLDWFDLVRIDHFRGLVSYWQVPRKEKTAVLGKWVKALPYDFLRSLFKEIPSNLLIAEDLGIITQDVKDVLREFKIPGMKVLLFAFGEDNPEHPYLIHNYEKNCIVYTGTHDNNTTKGWFDNEASNEEKSRLSNYLGKEMKSEDINWEMIRLAMVSVAGISIFPVQDILGLGENCRMNKPSTSSGNWKWRLTKYQLNSDISRKLKYFTEFYARGIEVS